MQRKQIIADPTIEEVFERLDDWRHLPAYKLEPRADIFFALFLPEVLGTSLGVPINPILVPEFPIKKGGDDNTSKKADYLALEQSEDGRPAKQAFLVELKTDMTSRREEQDAYLHNAAQDGLGKLIDGIIKIHRKTKLKKKYGHLLQLLSRLDLIDFGSGIPRNKVDPVTELEVVYVQPIRPRRARTIDFHEFARAIDKGRSDGMRGTFARYLRDWATQPGTHGDSD